MFKGLLWLLPVLVILVLVARWARCRGRAEKLRAWALGRDFSFIEADPALAGRYPSLPFRDGGWGQQCRNVVTGRLSGRPMTGFDYSYRTSDHDGDGSSSSGVHRWQVLAVDLATPLPRVSVTRKSLGSWVAVAFGGQDVEIGHPEFDRAFRIRCDDEAAAAALLLPMASVVLTRDDQAVQTDGSSLLILCSGLLQPADLDDWFADAAAVVKTLPV
jgi:hypothetical protein